MQRSDFIELKVEEGRVCLRLRALGMGDDLCILLDGGQRPHTGAVALAYVDTDVNTNNNADVAENHTNIHKVEVLCLEQHREDILAKQVAQKIQKRLNVTTTCLCGIHIPHISKQEIDLVYKKADELVNAFLAQYTVNT